MSRIARVLLLSLIPSLCLAADIRIGIVGLDTSHVPAFTEVLNNPAAKNHVAGAKVVAGFKGGSADIPSSADRVDGFTATLRDKYGVKICDSIEQLLSLIHI